MSRFEIYCKRKEESAVAAILSGFCTTADETTRFELVPLGNSWTRRLFDGNFFRSRGRAADRRAVGLVFVQSREGNTVADDPATLGGGATDKHLIYEGLSRVDADAVMAGAATVGTGDIVFSVWHPELVALRRQLGHDRHPVQVIVTGSAELPVEEGLMFSEPALRVAIVTRSGRAAALRERVSRRPWVHVIDAGEPLSLTAAATALQDFGVRVISAVGGRRTAAALLREGLVSDVYLTSSPVSGGEPGTPFYEGPPLTSTRVLGKIGRDEDAGVGFEHFLVSGAPV